MPNFGNADAVMDMFGDLFGDLFGGRRRRGPQGGRDLQMAIEIDLLQAARGVRKEIKIPRAESCADCSGSGAKPGTKPAKCRRAADMASSSRDKASFAFNRLRRVRRTGMVITDPSAPATDAAPSRSSVADGEHSAGRGQRREHPALRRGRDRRARRSAGRSVLRPPCPQVSAVRPPRSGPALRSPGDDQPGGAGRPIDVPTLDGTFVTHPLKRGTQGGDEVRISGKGMPHLRGGRAGDLVVHVRVVTPAS